MSAQAPPSRLREFLGNVPLLTLSLIGLCVVVYVADNIGDFGANISLFSISASAVVDRLELWRMITAAFCHGGIMHIGMNMMSLFQLGSGVEPMFGTIQYFFIITVFTVCCGVLYVVLSMVMSLYDKSYYYSSAVGFSGVLFAMAVDEASLSPFPTRSVFGLFSVPTRIYPWVLMLVLQFLLPNISFIGHLAGILVGFVHSFGWLSWAIPSLTTVRRIEQARWMQPLVRLPPFKLAPASEVLREGTSVRQTLEQAGGWLSYVFRPLTDCCARLGGRVAASASSSASAARTVSSSGRLSAAPATAASPAPPLRSLDAPASSTSSTSAGHVTVAVRSADQSGSAAAADARARAAAAALQRMQSSKSNGANASGEKAVSPVAAMPDGTGSAMQATSSTHAGSGTAATQEGEGEQEPLVAADGEEDGLTAGQRAMQRVQAILSSSTGTRPYGRLAERDSGVDSEVSGAVR